VEGARPPQSSGCLAAPSRRSLDDLGRLEAPGWDALETLGKCAIAASWISASSSFAPLPLMWTMEFGFSSPGGTAVSIARASASSIPRPLESFCFLGCIRDLWVLSFGSAQRGFV